MSVATESEEYSLSIAIPAEYFFVEDLFIDLCRLSTTALRRHPAYSKYVVFILNFVVMGKPQGGRTWQAFGGGKNGHETFRQARIYNFHDKCVVFARNFKFANLIQYNMQYIPCNSALLA